MSAPSKQPLDQELNLKALVLFTVALTVVVLSLAALMWIVSGALRGHLADQDPPPPTLPAARTQPLPPGPLLQTKPEDDLREMRREEDLLLSSYDWVDEAAGVARVPIEVAMDLMAEERTGQPTGEQTGEPAAAPAGEPMPASKEKSH